MRFLNQGLFIRIKSVEFVIKPNSTSTAGGVIPARSSMLRPMAAISALAAMADRTQVILFTHQAHVAELARGLGDGERVFVHGL